MHNAYVITDKCQDYKLCKLIPDTVIINLNCA